MNSKEVTAMLLSWLRYEKHMNLLATEVQVNASAADILAYHDGKFVEIEVKVSASDMRRDFTKVGHKTVVNRKRVSVAKHDHLQDSASSAKYKPNYFYFAVPDTLVDKALEVMSSEKSNGYGLLAVNSRGDVVTVKRATNLRKDDLRPFNHVKQAILLRMGSQMVKQARDAAGLPNYFKR